MSTNAPRDDLFTQIHKALRRALLSFTLELGRADADDGPLAAVAAEW